MINSKDIQENILFKFNGKVYQWKNYNGNWKQLCDKDGNIISPSDIPTELLLGADVENEE